MRIDVKVEGAGDAEEIEVVQVFVAVGAQVKQHDPILEVATDKANQEIVAPQDGIVVEILVATGDIIEPARPLAVLEVDG